MKTIRHIYIALALLFLATPAHAVISIDITRGNVDPMPIALPYFGTPDEASGTLSQEVMEVLQKDLESSGLFESINRRAFIQTIQGSETIPNFPDWRQVDAAALLTGGLKLSGANEFTTEFRLWDVFAQQQIAGKSYTTNRNNWRRISHMVADEVYHRLTGETGYFDTRIVYVSETGSVLKRVKRLAIMDQDGANHRFLTDGRDLVLTPRFSPAANKVIYMSYAGGTPRVHMLDVDTGRNELLGNFPGMSFAPRFSPDGNGILMSVAMNGNSEIYSLDLGSHVKRRLTNDSAIDTSPCYSPDGKQIVFNSDRGGSQQLYVMNSDGSNVHRISFSDRGRYGTPVWSPRGDLIAFTKMYQDTFYIGVMRPDGSGERLLTESFMDEGPTWSPNGRVIMFGRQSKDYGSKGGDWSVYSVDLTGYNEKKVQTPYGASDPAWSPLL